jgi:hypothetical protein
MCKDDGWFIRHVEPPNARRPSDNLTDRLAIGMCAGRYVRIDPVCEPVALSARSLQKSSMSASASRTSLYDEITANIFAEFEADRVPWA